ncbi:MAG: plasmid maintenance system antidote protein [Crocinitomicaceae bacterium]|nr:plasmid maintenance system antidote protein [Crocinitomicaceae bacterium]
MLPEISKIKGIHPGAILKRELKARGMKSNELAALVDEYTQTISAILNERRGINPGLSIKLGQQLSIDADYFMYLQASYDVHKEIEELNRNNRIPNLTNIRKALFWDTDFNKLDWDRNKSAIIKRIFERGNDQEISEIIAFYGLPTIKRVIRFSKNDFLPAYNENVKKHLSLKKH